MTTRKEWMARVQRLPFWMQDAALKHVVKKAFEEITLDTNELNMLRVYMQSWITWTALIPDDAEYIACMEEIAIASQGHLLSRTVDRLLELGIDPF